MVSRNGHRLHYIFTFIEANADVIEVELFEAVLQSTKSLLSAC